MRVVLAMLLAVSAMQAAVTSGVTKLQTSVADTGSGVKAVYFRVDGTLICSDTTVPYECPWDTRTVLNGQHTIAVRAEDNAGNVSEPSTVTVTVDNPCIPKGKSGKCR